MKTNIIFNFKTFVFFSTLILTFNFSFSQNDSIPKQKSPFWQKVQFGGGLGLGFGNGFTNISVAPMGYYNINQKFTVGVGLNGSYIAQNSFYKSTIVGASIIGITNQLEFLQLSAELEQLKVNTKFEGSNLKSDFWNTALFLGAGYRNQNFTLGMRYNILHKASDRAYSDAFMPFVRVVF
jgi:long-subunit fatty acid transport protein